MPFAVLLIALVLIVLGLGATLMGFSLVPTDLGRMWLDVGTRLFTGGMIVLALGYAAKAVIQAMAVEDIPMPEAAREAAPASVEPPALQEPPPLQPPTLPPEPDPRPLAPVLGGLAAGGAILTASAGAWSGERETAAPAPPEPPPLPVEPPPVSLAPADDVLFGEDDFALRLEPPAAPLMPPPIPQALPEAAPPPRFLRDEPEDEPEDESAPEPARPPVAGLIADDDLAALQDEAVALAPLDQLEVVGAYDSGGVRFTMYSDGSVNALAPHGERRYPSLEALRARLDSGEAAV